MRIPATHAVQVERDLRGESTDLSVPLHRAGVLLLVVLLLAVQTCVGVGHEELSVDSNTGQRLVILCS